MNALRRKELQKVFESIVILQKWFKALYEEESEYLDNIPENLQGTERYEKSQSAVVAMEVAILSLKKVAESIKKAQE